MTHTELVNWIARNCGSASAAKAAVRLVVMGIHHGLIHDRKVAVRGLGTLKVHQTPSRQITDVSSGQVTIATASYRGSFKLHSDLKAALGIAGELSLDVAREDMAALLETLQDDAEVEAAKAAAAAKYPRQLGPGMVETRPGYVVFEDDATSTACSFPV